MRPGPPLVFALAFAAAASAVALQLPDHLDEDTCTRYFINNVPDDPLLEKEHCTLCQLITENSEKWDYVSDLASLCTGVPPHAMDWVRTVLYLPCCLVNLKSIKMLQIFQQLWIDSLMLPLTTWSLIDNCL